MKALKWLGLLMLAVLIFIGFTAAILAYQGRLNQETVASFWGMAKIEEDNTAPQQASKPQISFQLPAPFRFGEIAQLSKELQQSKENYEHQLALLQAEKAQLQKIRDDIEERRREVEKMMKKVSALYEEVENKRRQWQQDKLSFAEEQEDSLQKLAKMFEGMNVEQAAERLGKVPLQTGAKILFLMRPRNASKILSQLQPEQVKALTELMQKRMVQGGNS